MIEFEWDLQKEIHNISKHGVSFWEAADTFSDPRGIMLKDLKHSNQENRYFWIGKSKNGRILTTLFTWRAEKIRIIGSGYWRKYRRLYETTQNR